MSASEGELSFGSGANGSSETGSERSGSQDRAAQHVRSTLHSADSRHQSPSPSAGGRGVSGGRDGTANRASRSRSRSTDRRGAGGRGQRAVSRSRSRSWDRGRGRSSERVTRRRSRSRSSDRSRSHDQGRVRDGDRRMDRARDYDGYRDGDGSRQRSRSRDRRTGGRQRSGSDRAAAEDACDTLFVGDLPFEVTSDRLFHLFDDLVPGGIAEARVMTGQKYGFVTFKDPRAATVLLSEAGAGGTGPEVRIEGKVVTVAPADKRQERRWRSHAHRPKLRDSHTASPAERSARAAAAAIVSGASALLQSGMVFPPAAVPYGAGYPVSRDGSRHSSLGPRRAAGHRRATEDEPDGQGGTADMAAAWAGSVLSPASRHTLAYDDL